MELANMFGDVRLIDQIKTWSIPDFPLRGSDLIALNVQPGPLFGSLLFAAKSYWIEQDYRPSKSDLIEFVQHRLGE